MIFSSICQLIHIYMASTLLRRKQCHIPTIHINVAHTLTPSSWTFSRLNQSYFHTSSIAMDGSTRNPTKEGDKNNGDHGSTDGELNQWKFRAPYKVHENDPNFYVRYQASCHCGKVKYQLSREKPLDSKFCHCTTCQKLHGTGDVQFPFQIMS